MYLLGFGVPLPPLMPNGEAGVVGSTTSFGVKLLLCRSLFNG